MAPAAALAIAGVVAASCANRRSAGAAPVTCAPTVGELPASASAGELTGTFRLTLVATSGARSGRTVTGNMSLVASDSAARMVGGVQEAAVAASMPLYGSTDIDLGEVGALRLGMTATADPAAPGVAVFERRGTVSGAPFAEITIRFGSDANRRSPQRFDGGFTALYVRRVSAEGFGGAWASGVTGRDAEGFFCAVRAGP